MSDSDGLTDDFVLEEADGEDDSSDDENDTRRSTYTYGAGYGGYAQSYAAYYKIDYTKNAGDDTPGVAGVVGLRNLGNTDFINCALQCVIHSLPLALRQFFLDSSYRSEVNLLNKLGSKGEFVNGFAEILSLMWSGEHSILTPRGFKYMLGKLQPSFSGYSHHDTFEVVEVMLDSLHEDLNRIIHKPLTERVDGTEIGGASVARESWHIMKMRDDSAIVDSFWGQTEVRSTCPVCLKTRFFYDSWPMWTLAFPEIEGPQQADEMSLGALLRHFAGPRVLGDHETRYCRSCKEHHRAKESRALFRLPEVLILQVQRSSAFWTSARKIETTVTFPSVLSLRHFYSDSADEIHLPFDEYELVALQAHREHPYGGHNTAWAKGPTASSQSESDWIWYVFDDSAHGTVREEEALDCPDVCLLFYRGIPKDPFLKERSAFAMRHSMFVEIGLSGRDGGLWSWESMLLLL